MAKITLVSRKAGRGWMSWLYKGWTVLAIGRGDSAEESRAEAIDLRRETRKCFPREQLV